MLHAASQDLPACARSASTPSASSTPSSPRACSGMPRVGLGAVVEELLGITLAKEHSAADWSTRPLPQAWLEYAALDVELLVDVRDTLVAELAEQPARPSSPRRSSTPCCDTRGRSRAAAEPWRRLSGIHAVRGPRKPRGRARAVARPRRTTPRSSTSRPAGWCPTRSILAAAQALADRRRSAARRPAGVHRPREPLASSTAGGRPSSAACTTDDLPAGPRARATRRRRPARGRCATPRPTRGCKARARRRRRGRRGARHAGREPAHPRSPAPRRVASARSRRPPMPSPPRSRQLGARPWQIEATAQMIADAFVEACTIRSRTPRRALRRFRQPIQRASDAFVGSRHPDRN